MVKFANKINFISLELLPFANLDIIRFKMIFLDPKTVLFVCLI